MADSDFDDDDVQDSRRVAAAKANLNPKLQTVKDPQRMAFPGIYGNPKEIAAKAASRVAPEDPALKQLFGVTRGDLYEMNQGRKGNLPGTLPGAAAKPRGAASAARVMTKENEQRLVDTLGEAQKHESLRHGMEPWYITDPAFQRMVHLIGFDNAVREYDKMNHLIGMASPASEVMTEIPRGTAAYSLNTQGRFKDFLKYAGMPEGKRTRRFPADIRNVPGHAYHKTAQAGPMSKYLESGEMTMKTPKVPLYIQASGVPETGFQTATPVGDAHWSRAVGLADTRNWKTVKGKQAIPGASVTNPEMAMLSPWWRSQIANKVGLEPVSAQGLTWGTFAPQTGVDTPIGAGKLELLAKNIMMTARRLNVSPEVARDMVLMGKTYAGKAEGGSVGYAEGGSVEPSQDEMLARVMLRKDNISLKDIGANEAPNMKTKAYAPPSGGPGFPVGGVDFQPENPGQQMLPGVPGQPPGQPPQAGGLPGAPGQPPAPAGGQPGQPPGQPPQAGGQPGQPPQGGPSPLLRSPQSNILSMTRQGQALQAMRPNPAPVRPGAPMPKMADGGSVEDMRRALGKFLEGSHTQQRLYHGTTTTEGGKGKEAFRNLKASKEGALGSGVYLTPDPDFAGEYAKKPGGNVLPVHARITNPLVIRSKRGQDPMIMALVQLGMTPDKAANMVEKAYEQKGYIGKQVQQRAQAAGHDALMQYRDGDLTEVVHYNPRMIKSATGNRGTYDTSKDDLSMARGGTVGSHIKLTERKL